MATKSLNAPPSRGHAGAPTPGALMTVQEAADYLQVCTKTIRTLIAKGKLPSGRVGKQYRLSRQSLDAYIGLGKTR